MKFTAQINVMPHKALLDPQGKAVTASMKNLGIPEIQNIRIGKHFELEIEADSETIALQKVEKACKELLSNPIMEGFQIEISSN